jgi:hypothetical protein
MPFHAAKPTPCIKCPVIIAQGEPISWTRGKGAQPGVYHFVCPGETPAAVSFDAPHLNTPIVPDDALAAWAEPVLIDDDPLELVENEPVPQPGTRAWFKTATLADRQEAILSMLAPMAVVNERTVIKLTARYARGLSDKETARLRRWGWGVWDGLHMRFVEDDGLDGPIQCELFPRALITEHSEDTQRWRTLMAEWATVPA